MSPAVSCFVAKFFGRIYLVGILPLLPDLTSGISAPLMQYTFSVFLPVGASFPQSPFKVDLMSSENVPVDHLLFSRLSIKHFLNITLACCSKLLFVI